jgi:hypothetical protein
LLPPLTREARLADCLLYAVLGRRATPENVLDTLFPRWAGLAVHKANVVVRIRRADRPGKALEAVRTFATRTRDPLALSDGLAEHGITHVARESTGVYGKPVVNLLEGRFQVLLANAEHSKQVPGSGGKGDNTERVRV